MTPATDPADFYTGIVVDAYAALRSTTFDPGPYLELVRTSGEPALELGCGEGGPFLDLVAAGVDVEGVDASADMLERCASRAADRGLRATTHLQRMERLRLPRRFRSIYLAGPTFTLLPDDDAAAAALGRIAEHLTPGGTAMVPLWTPAPTPPAQIGMVRTATGEDGASLRYVVLTEDVDSRARTRRTHVRYERELDGRVEREERDWVVHWHERDGFAALAAAAGLDVERTVDVGEGEWVAYLRPRPSEARSTPSASARDR